MFRKIVLVITAISAMIALTQTGEAMPSHQTVPVAYGPELVTDPGMESWSDANTLAYWNQSVSGTTTINQESSVVHTGTYAARADVDASNSVYTVQQSNLAIGEWYLVSAYMRRGAATNCANITDGSSTIINPSLTTTWTRYTATFRAKNNNKTTWSRCTDSTSSSIYFDDASVVHVTLASMFAGTVSRSSVNVDVSAEWAITTSTQAGVVASLDSPSNPGSFVIAYYSSISGVILDKCINGLYSNLLSVSTAYVAGATIKIVRRGTTYQVFYNGTQRGADQTINDASLGTYYGAFSAYDLNSYSGLTISDMSTATPTSTPSDTPTPSSTFTPSHTSSFTPTPSYTSSRTYTPSYTPSETPSNTPTDTATYTFTPTDTATPTRTYTPSITFTPTITDPSFGFITFSRQVTAGNTLEIFGILIIGVGVAILIIIIALRRK